MWSRTGRPLSCGDAGRATDDPAAIDAGAGRVRDYAAGPVLAQVETLLGTDIDEQWTSPLRTRTPRRRARHR